MPKAIVMNQGPKGKDCSPLVHLLFRLIKAKLKLTGSVSPTISAARDGYVEMVLCYHCHLVCVLVDQCHPYTLLIYYLHTAHGCPFISTIITFGLTWRSIEYGALEREGCTRDGCFCWNRSRDSETAGEEWNDRDRMREDARESRG